MYQIIQVIDVNGVEYNTGYDGIVNIVEETKQDKIVYAIYYVSGEIRTLHRINEVKTIKI